MVKDAKELPREIARAMLRKDRTLAERMSALERRMDRVEKVVGIQEPETRPGRGENRPAANREGRAEVAEDCPACGEGELIMDCRSSCAEVDYETVIKVIREHPEGLHKREIAKLAGLNPESINSIIDSVGDQIPLAQEGDGTEAIYFEIDWRKW